MHFHDNHQVHCIWVQVRKPESYMWSLFLHQQVGTHDCNVFCYALFFVFVVAFFVLFCLFVLFFVGWLSKAGFIWKGTLEIKSSSLLSSIAEGNVLFMRTLSLLILFYFILFPSVSLCLSLSLTLFPPPPPALSLPPPSLSLSLSLSLSVLQNKPPLSSTLICFYSDVSISLGH